MRFTKVHGLGNDFVLVDAAAEPDLPADLPALARRICDRHFGVGADGLVLLWPSEVADIRMQIFNPDGSEAEMCGNAIRCVAKYVVERGMVNGEDVRVETGAGIKVPVVTREGKKVSRVRVDMGEPVLERSSIPMVGPAGRVVNEPLTVDGVTYRVTAVSMGNPHCVVFVPDLKEVDLKYVGPLLEKHPVFPKRTNVEFVEVIDPVRISMRVWERGAGLTLACGTGACAAVVAGVLNGYTGRQVSVRLDGGTLEIEWGEDNRVYMTGPAEEVFTGDYPVLKREVQ